MDGDEHSRLVSSIYDAALDGSRWSVALFALAEATRCRQASLQIFDEQSASYTSLAPMCDPAFMRSHRDYWRSQFSLRGRIEGRPVGQVFSTAEILDLERFRTTAYYNEWWRPQGVGGGSLIANVLRDGRAAAVVSANKAFSERAFSKRDRELFCVAIEHFMRALKIHRRLCLTEMASPGIGEKTGFDSFLVVDRGLNVLLASDAARRRLLAAGLLVANGMEERLDLSVSETRHGPAGASPKSSRPALRGGDYHHRAPDGTRLCITIIPVQEQDRNGKNWLVIDQPAALVHVSAPEDERRSRVARLVEAHGLTPAEAAVAVEIAKGDGRAAAAARLQIRETTVRSHLSAIFEKLGIHRQAQLTRLVAAQWDAPNSISG